MEFAYFQCLRYGNDYRNAEKKYSAYRNIEVSKELERHYRKYGIEMLTETRVLFSKDRWQGRRSENPEKDGTEETLKADLALNAIGIQANIENIGLKLRCKGLSAVLSKLINSCAPM